MNKKVLLYIVESIVLFAVACFVIPKVARLITNGAYKYSVKRRNNDEEDWGPEIVKKSEVKEEKEE